MSSTSVSVRALQPRLLRAILVGGALAGTFDLIVAFILFGRAIPDLHGWLVGNPETVG
jgi:hypothetical protein